MRPLLVWPQARLEITEAASWYEERRQGFGIQFLDEVDHVLNRIRREPFQFPEIDPEVRRGLLRLFPYSVYFIVGDANVEIIAVLHQHRHPDTWKNRARNSNT